MINLRDKLTGQDFRQYVIRIVVVALGILFHCPPCAFAGNQTTAETVTATPLHASISLSAPYTDDDNADNTLLVEWGSSGVDFSLGSEALPHSASPYTYQIPGLDNGKTY